MAQFQRYLLWRKLSFIATGLLVQTVVSEQAVTSEALVRRARNKVDAAPTWRGVFVNEDADDSSAGVRRSDLHSDRSGHQLKQGVKQQARFVVTSDLIADLEYRRTQERRHVLTQLVGTRLNNVTIWLVSWTVGWALCCFCSLLSALGYVLQKYAHVLIMRKDVEKEGCYFLNAWWLGGFLVWLSAEIVNVIATTLAPNLLLQCTKSWTCTCLVAISRVLLGEEVGFKAFAVITGLLFGSALIGSYAPVAATPETILGRSSLELSAITSRFVSAGVVCGVLAFTLLVTTTSAGKYPMCRGGDTKPLQWKYSAFFWAGFASLCAGCTQTLFKCIVVLAMAAPGEAFSMYPTSYALLISTLLCGIVEVHSLNLGLKMGDAVLLLPLYLTLSTVSQVFLCGIVFGELGQFSSANHAGLFCLGVWTLLGSVWLLLRMPASLATWQLRETA